MILSSLSVLLVLASSVLSAQSLEERLNQMAEAAFRARPTLSTKASVLERQAQVRAAMLRQIGGFPEQRTPLNARITGSFQRDGYRVDNLIYESQPKLYVTANLYVPTTGRAPYPAILGVAGHSANGKASATYQHAWISFARRGFIVLAFDPPGQGERLETIDPATGVPRVGIGTSEHIHNGLQLLLTGHHFARYESWDGIRGFDYLASRPDVDATRIAVAGNSGGGTQAAYLAVFEPRLATIIASCYMTSWRDLWYKPGPQDAEQVFPNFLKDGLDFPDFALAAAPKHFLMTTAIQDFFPIDGARKTYAEIRRLYALLDVESRAGYFEYDDKHGWSQPRREAAYEFLGKPGKEAPVDPEPEQLLYATKTGQVITSLGGETTQSINARYALELEKQRKPLTREIVIERIAYQPNGLTQSAGGAVSMIALNMADADRSDYQDARHLTLINNEGARPGYSPAYQVAMRALLVGRTLLGMQVDQILQATRGQSKVHLYARGSAAVAALHAAYLSPAIERLTLEQMPLSYQAIAQAKLHRNLVEIIVPGVLRDYDLPDLAKGIAGRTKITLIDTRDPAGRGLLHDRVKPLYPAAQLVYRKEGATLAQTLR